MQQNSTDAPARRTQGRGVLALGLAGLVMVGCTGTPSKPSPNQTQGPAPAPQQGQTAAQPEVIPANATNVLQSVQVQVAPTGQVGAIDSTAIATSGGSSSGTTVTNAWTGSEAGQDLPVRVQAAWRMLDQSDRTTRSGTNLAELEGHTGRVQIDLTVQNLTAKPTDVTVDVGGRSHTRRMMVGVPLSVVASTSMPNVPAAQVVTPSATSTRKSTNGVLSQGTKGETVVQWATLLAPPRTGGSTTLHLVVDAKDFSAPTFDLSIQPGLVTDASMASLLDASVAPKGSRELELQRQTVTLVAQVNDVLGQASKSIDTMRDNLSTTSKTLGSQTVQDMAQSSERIAASMKQLDGQLTSLRGNIASSMDQTNQVVLQSLDQTIQLTDKMLGDTSAAPNGPQVIGEGCRLSSASSTRSTSVYGNLMQVVGALDTYSKLADGCRGQVRTQIAAMIGPADPAQANACPDPAKVDETTPLSVTCSMYVARERFSSTVATQLRADAQTALDALDPKLMGDVLATTGSLSTDVDEVAATAADLTAADKPASAADTAALTTQLGQLSTSLGALVGQQATIHAQALRGKEQAAQMVQQNEAAAGQLCQVIATEVSTPSPTPADPSATPADPSTTPTPAETPSAGGTPSASPSPDPTPSEQPTAEPTQPTGAPRDQIERVRALLTTTSCPDAQGRVTELPRPQGYAVPMSVLLQQQETAWVAVADATAETGSPMTSALQQVRDDLAAVLRSVDAIERGQATDQTGVAAARKALDVAVAQLGADRAELVKQMAALKTQQDGLTKSVTDAFTKAEKDGQDTVGAAVDMAVRQTAEQGQVSADALDQMFAAAANGLGAESVGLGEAASRSVDEQKAQVKAAAKTTQDQVSQQLTQGLTQIAATVGTSTRDTQAANVQLANDLKAVLLDLGNASVGGKGLLGAMSTSAATATSASASLASASTKVTDYGNLRNQDVIALLTERAQDKASTQSLAELPPFRIAVPESARHRTVYTFHVGTR